MDVTQPPLASSPSQERYTLHLESLGVDAAELSVASNGTVASQVTPRLPPDSQLLPLVSLSEDSTAELGILKTLGVGGMGKVMLAVQRPLQREVAVKTPKSVNAKINAELLREALVTGRLEHPNIVPVHLLGRGEDGAPFFVMKRIEGTLWRELLDSPDALAALGARAADPLRFHLGVLLEVCDAMSFAHSRGVLHRDLKPDNVMLGRFGEVYVLDWGIAVTVAPDPHLVSARESSGVCGTPAYMAPEMAGGIGAELSERTDVYLLGAVLHHILNGRGPHRGGTLLATLTQAWESKPPVFSAGVPEELAAICSKALSREVVARFDSVQTFRDALELYLRRRESLALAAEGERRVAALEAAVSTKLNAANGAASASDASASDASASDSSASVASASDASASVASASVASASVASASVASASVASASVASASSSPELDTAALHAMFAESRFAFQQVRLVPGMEATARAGLHRAHVAIARAEIAVENLAAASAHLAQLDEVPAALTSELDALRVKLDARRARVAALEQLERDADIELGSGMRARVAFSVAAVCSFAMLAIAVLLRMDLMAFGYREAVIGMSLFGFGTLGVEAWLRSQLRINAAQQKLLFANRLALSSFVLFWAGAWSLNIAFTAAATAFMFHVACLWGAASALFDKRGWPVAAAFAFGALSSGLLPGFQFEVFAAATFLGFGGLGFTWRARRK